MEEKEIIQAVRRWVDTFVVDMNLCPFAKRELVNERVRFVVTDATSPDQLLLSLQAECEKLTDRPSVETTILIHPNVLQDFSDYNQFLDIADLLLEQMGLEGVYQIASFHPAYQFAGTRAGDAENYTNRSPYPILHLLREASLSQRIAEYPDVGQIPIRNTELMNRLGADKLKRLLQACFEAPDSSENLS